MKAKVFHRENCRLCGSRSVEIVVALAPIPLAEKYVTKAQLGVVTEVYPVDIYMRRDCGHVQLLDVIDPDVLWMDYTYHSGQTKGIIDHFEDLKDSESINTGADALKDLELIEDIWRMDRQCSKQLS